jgi:hypothetical protein
VLRLFIKVYPNLIAKEIYFVMGNNILEAKKVNDDTVLINGVMIDKNDMLPSVDGKSVARLSRPAMRISLPCREAEKSNVLTTINNLLETVFDNNVEIFEEGITFKDIQHPLREDFKKVGKKMLRRYCMKTTTMTDNPPLLIDKNREEISPEEFHVGDVCKAAITFMAYNFKDDENKPVRTIVARLRVLQKLHDAEVEADSNIISTRELVASF